KSIFPKMQTPVKSRISRKRKRTSQINEEQTIETPKQNPFDVSTTPIRERKMRNRIRRRSNAVNKEDKMKHVEKLLSKVEEKVEKDLTKPTNEPTSGILNVLSKETLEKARNAQYDYKKQLQVTLELKKMISIAQLEHTADLIRS